MPRAISQNHSFLSNSKSGSYSGLIKEKGGRSLPRKSFASPELWLDGAESRADCHDLTAKRVEVVEVAVEDVRLAVSANACCVGGAVEFVLNEVKVTGPLSVV